MEGSHSGLVRHLGKVVWEKSHRGFKSLTLRNARETPLYSRARVVELIYVFI